MTSPLNQRKDKNKDTYNIAFIPINYYMYKYHKYLITQYTTINTWNVVRQSWNKDNGMIMQFPHKTKRKWKKGGNKNGQLAALSISTIHIKKIYWSEKDIQNTV